VVGNAQQLAVDCCRPGSADHNDGGQGFADSAGDTNSVVARFHRSVQGGFELAVARMARRDAAA